MLGRGAGAGPTLRAPPDGVPLSPPPAPLTTVRDDDRGLLYGDGVFDTMLGLDGLVVRLDRHLDRLAAGADALGIRFDRSDAASRARAVAFGRAGESAVRVTVTRGPGVGLSPAGAGPATVLARAGPVPWTEADRSDGVAAAFARLRRVPAACFDPAVKSLNYLPNVLARKEAAERGAREALFLDLAGDVVEGAASNVFAVVDGTLVTPPVSAGCFPGFARADVLALARADGIPCAEGNLSPAALAGASEAFLTSSLAGIVPIVALEGSRLREGIRGPVTARLQSVYARSLKSGMPSVKGR